MKSETVAGISLFYEPEEQETARLIREACEKTVQIIHEHWGVPLPPDCRVYVMTSWLSFLFHSAPWPGKIILALTLPLVTLRARSIWPYAGGWAFQYGRRRAVGIKPYRLILSSDRRLGNQIFKQDVGPAETVQTITCHELTHAFTSHLKLPTWFNEGLATLAMEHYLGRQIVQEATIEFLTSAPELSKARGRESLRFDQPRMILYQYARGYWLTRYLAETRPEVLGALLRTRQRSRELEARLAAAFGKNPEGFWASIDQELVARFRSQAAS